MSKPFVTIVLAVRNESAYIARCLGAVLAQNWPAERMEILVADGESTDGTPDIIRALPGSERIQLITNPDHRQAAGLNAAIAHARGDVIVRVDGHTQIAPDYVRCCVIALEETGAACVGGRIEPIGITPMGAVIAAVAHTAFAVPGAFHVGQTACFTDTVYMGAWPANVLARSGGFDERLRANEDYELAYRIRQSGGSVYLSPAIRSTYFGRQTLTALARQYFVYGIGKAQVLRKYPTSLRMRQLAAPLFVAGVLGGAVCWFLAPITHLLWLAMLFAYALLNLGFSAFVATRERSPSVWLSPMVYLMIHLCWGIGFWTGLLPRIRLPLRLRRRSLSLSPHP
jgi:glycosyltransferase involved in cell wall biosynthesis